MHQRAINKKLPDCSRLKFGYVRDIVGDQVSFFGSFKPRNYGKVAKYFVKEKMFFAKELYDAKMLECM